MGNVIESKIIFILPYIVDSRDQVNKSAANQLLTSQWALRYQIINEEIKMQTLMLGNIPFAEFTFKKDDTYS